MSQPTAPAMTPYSALPETAFWATGVARLDPLAIGGLWRPKAALRPEMPIATYGSCFAQHFSRALQARGFSWLEGEPAPPGLPADRAAAYGYGIFSARTGNIYTTGLLRQWLAWACGTERIPDEIWEQEGRFYDPFRPRIEPQGFASPEEVRNGRALVLEAIRRSVTGAKLFVFTLGLTESWIDAVTGVEYPMCPGTAAGTFEPARHRFVNRSYPEVLAALETSLALLWRLNPELRVLLTVSPVPLTATASGEHVLVATSYSKSVLRAVAGAAAAAQEQVDYFPSYEIISTPPYRGAFFAPNLRSVTPAGVDHVMAMFFACLEKEFPGSLATGPADPALAPSSLSEAGGQNSPAEEAYAEEEDLVCEEALLAAFAPGSPGAGQAGGPDPDGRPVTGSGEPG